MLLDTDQHVQVNIAAAQTEISSREKLFDVTTEQIYATARARLKALARVAPFMKKILIKAFFTAFLRIFYNTIFYGFFTATKLTDYMNVV